MKELFNVTKNSINKVTGDLFIIPNRARRYGDITFDAFMCRYKKITDENGIILTDNTKFVHVGIFSKDLGNTNICDHGVSVMCDNEEVFINPNIMDIPEELLHGKKEGDHISLKFIEKGIPFEIDLRLSQSEYSQNFDTFEEVLSGVTR